MNLKMIAAVMLASIAVQAHPALAGIMEQVLQHHVAAMKSGDVDALLSDYAAEAVVVVPAGILHPADARGTPDILTGAAPLRHMYEFFTDIKNMPGIKTFDVRFEQIAPDVELEHWSIFQGTPQAATGTDVFVIRQGKIVFQSVEAPAPGANGKG